MSSYEKAGELLALETNKADFCFEYDKQLYRYSKNKVKLLCRAYPKLLYATKDERFKHTKINYIFDVTSPLISNSMEIHVPGLKMASKTRFSNALLTYIPFSRFEGNKEDFQCFQSQLFENIVEVREVI